jgi:hypothetical protein
MHTAIESFRREIEAIRRGDAEYRARIETKLDQLLTSRAGEAERMGALQEQMRGLAATVQAQGVELGVLREKLEAAKDAPKDSLLRALFEIGKLIVAAVIGYFTAGKLHR